MISPSSYGGTIVRRSRAFYLPLLHVACLPERLASWEGREEEIGLQGAEGGGLKENEHVYDAINGAEAVRLVWAL